MYLPPLFAGLGSLLTFLIQIPPLGLFLLTLASLGGVTILIEITRPECVLNTFAMFASAQTGPPATCYNKNTVMRHNRRSIPLVYFHAISKKGSAMSIFSKFLKNWGLERTNLVPLFV